MKRNEYGGIGGVLTLGLLVCCLALTAWCPQSAQAQAGIGTGTYSFKIYHVNYGFYPIVQAYLRTWDDSREPLLNLNLANIGIQVKGRNYDPATAIPAGQYSIDTLERRSEGFRTVIVLDASGSMRGEPFADAVSAIQRFIELKRPVDQVALLAIRDEGAGFEIVSHFENNPSVLYNRLQDVQCDGQLTRLYDTVAAALEMSATAFRGEVASTDHAVLTTIVVMSDGKDEGSAITRSELLNHIAQLAIPVPIHALAFTRVERSHLLNIEALSRATLGNYWDLDSTDQLTRAMQEIHHINRSDYVVTFRAYVPVDGEEHTFRLGVEYPSGSGSFLFGSGVFEAIESPAVYNPALNEQYQSLLQTYQELPNPPGPYGGTTGSTALPDASLAELPDGLHPEDFDGGSTQPEADEDEGGDADVDVEATETEDAEEGAQADDDRSFLNRDWLYENRVLLFVLFAVIALLAFASFMVGVIFWMRGGNDA